MYKRQKLGYDASKDTKDLKTMTPDVYSKIMNVANDSSLQLYSSAKIQKLGEKSPLEVKIETPENITKVSQDMYRNAAVTLGVEHARITVAAPIPVTGESALAGIYYSLESNGVQSVSYTHLSTIGTGDRSERIRTYNFPQNRVTDHRIGLTLQKLDTILAGKLDEVVDALVLYDQTQKLEELNK